jgi:hypothetical protein
VFKTDDALYAAVEDYARVTGTSKSWVCRAALKRLLEDLPQPAREDAPAVRLRADDGSWNGFG